MWPAFDPQFRREFEHIRRMVALRYQTPRREWPLPLGDRHDDLLVVREWPDGSLTAYVMPIGRQ